MIQADHISGEVIGTVVEDFYRAGAFNVQVIPTITKKNRPGYLFFIDIAPGDNNAIEHIIISELGVTGWHIINSVHHHVAADIMEREVVFGTPEEPLRFKALIKIQRARPEQMRPEHSSCLAIRECLREKSIFLSLNEIYQSIVKQLSDNKQHSQYD